MKDLRAEAVMVKPVVSARERTDAKEIALLLLSGHFTGVPVTDEENKVIGVVTEFDLLRALKDGKDLAGVVAGDLMSKGAITADVSTPVTEIVNIMTERNILRLPITRQGKLVGIVARADILRSQLDPAIFVL